MINLCAEVPKTLQPSPRFDSDSMNCFCPVPWALRDYCFFSASRAQMHFACQVLCVPPACDTSGLPIGSEGSRPRAGLLSGQLSIFLADAQGRDTTYVTRLCGARLLQWRLPECKINQHAKILFHVVSPAHHDGISA